MVVKVTDLKHDMVGFSIEQLAELAVMAMYDLYKSADRNDKDLGFYAFLISRAPESFLGERYCSDKEVADQAILYYANLWYSEKGVGINFDAASSDKLDEYDYIKDNFSNKYCPIEDTKKGDDIACVAIKIALGIYGFANAGMAENKDNVFVEQLVEKNDDNAELLRGAGYLMNRIILSMIYVMTSSSSKKIMGTNDDDQNIDATLKTWTKHISYALSVMSFYLYREITVYYNTKDAFDILKQIVQVIVDTCKATKSEGTFMELFAGIRSKMTPTEKSQCVDILVGKTTMSQTNDLTVFDKDPFRYFYRDESPISAYAALQNVLDAVSSGGRGRDSRDSRDDNRGRGRDSRDSRDSRDNRGRDSRRQNNNDTSKFLETVRRGGRDDRGRGRDSRDVRDDDVRGGRGRDSRDSRDSRDNRGRDSRDSRDNRGRGRDSRDSRDDNRGRGRNNGGNLSSKFLETTRR